MKKFKVSHRRMPESGILRMTESWRQCGGIMAVLLYNSFSRTGVEIAEAMKTFRSMIL